MDASHRLGAKLRELRRKNALTQAVLAERLGISPSYLNLLENDKRPLPAAILLKLVDLFRLDLEAFRAGEEARIEHDLNEALSDPAFESEGVDASQVRRFVLQSPELARSMLALYRAFRSTRESVDGIPSKFTEPAGATAGGDSVRISSELVSDFLEAKLNHFPALEDAAERLRKDAHLDDEDLFAALARFLERKHRVEVKVEEVGAMHGALRRFDPKARELVLSEVLRRGSRNFQLAHQVALLHFGPLLDTLVADSQIAASEARALARVSLANYFACAVLMPYDAMLTAAKDVRYDIELLGHRFRSSFEQVCHRLTTLRRRGAEGVPFDFVRVDIAGNISKKFSSSGGRFPRFSGLCPLWNVHAAFLRPGFIRTQVSIHEDARAEFSVACTIERHRGGYRAPRVLYAVALSTDVESAREMVYADGVDLKSKSAMVPVGMSCRMCTRLDCEARAFPPLREPLRIDENVLGQNFYAPVR